MDLHVLITGASRGIGLEMARQFAADGATVHACARDPQGSAALAELGRQGVKLHALDVADEASIDALAAQLRGSRLDLLINNAGITGGGNVGAGRFGLEDASMETLLATFRTNAAGPLLLTRALLENLKRGKDPKVVMMTSRMGSIGDGPSGGFYPYRISKAAMNMMGHNLAQDLRPDGIPVLILHPGWVQTDMGGRGAKVPVDEAVRKMRKVIDAVRIDDTGTFRDLDGRELPW